MFGIRPSGRMFAGALVGGGIAYLVASAETPRSNFRNYLQDIAPNALGHLDATIVGLDAIAAQLQPKIFGGTGAIWSDLKQTRLSIAPQEDETPTVTPTPSTHKQDESNLDFDNMMAGLNGKSAAGPAVKSARPIGP